MKKIEKVTIYEQKLKEFVKKAKESCQIELFATEIDGKKYEIYLCFDKFNEFDEYRCFYIYANAIDFILCCNGSEFADDIDESDKFVKFYPKERVNFKKIYEMAKSYTDNFIDTINKQEEFIEECESQDDYEDLAVEISDIWLHIGLTTNDFDPDSFEYLTGWLCEQIEKKTTKTLITGNFTKTMIK